MKLEKWSYKYDLIIIIFLKYGKVKMNSNGIAQLK